MNQSELKFVTSVGEDYKVSSKNEDIHEHWDVRTEKYGKVDVKGIKRKRRHGELNENIHYVELTNVHGNKGWLYGESDNIAFETEQYWIIVPTDRLRDWVWSVNEDEYCNEPKFYKLYRRVNRKDVMMLVKTLDLCYLSSEIIKK